MKRVELHAARATLMGVDHLLVFASQQARRGGNNPAADLIRESRDALYAALQELVEALATN